MKSHKWFKGVDWDACLQRKVVVSYHGLYVLENNVYPVFNNSRSSVLLCGPMKHWHTVAQALEAQYSTLLSTKDCPQIQQPTFAA